MTDLMREVSGHIDPEWIATHTEALCRIRSETLDEAAVCTAYAKELEALGLQVVRRQVTPGRDNLYACVPSAGGGPSLALNGHLDTIPIGEAWPFRREGDRLHARGAEDMKGPMVSLLAMLRGLQRAGVRLKGDLWITAVVGHEEASAAKDGPLAFCDDVNAGQVRADRILIVEGDADPWIMSMGSANFVITLHSPLGGTHTNYVPFEQNPIRFMGDFIAAVARRQAELNATTHHGLAGSERIDIATATAGDHYNRTPGTVTFVGTRRWLPDKTEADIRAELEELIRPIAQAGELTWQLRLEQAREPFETAPTDPLVKATCRAAEQVQGRPPKLLGRRLVGDANYYVQRTGVPTIYYGPGGTSAHADDEWVSLNALVRAAQVYALTAMDFCGVEASAKP